MKKKKYFISRDGYNDATILIDYNNQKGFTFNPKNEIDYNGLVINKMILINPSFIEKVLEKKTKKQLNVFLRFIIDLIDDDNNSANPTSLKEALNELTRYKDLVNNKYKKYLNAKYIKLLLNKIEVLEHELKSKMLYMLDSKEAKQDNLGKSR